MGAATQSSEAPVLFFDKEQVSASFSKGAILLDGTNRNYMVNTSRRDTPGQAEIHRLDTDIIYVVEGSATFVTGGTAVEIKDINLPDNMQRAMAKEAEAERERRAKIVAAEGEFQASVKLGEAADIITAHPVALQLRTLQTMAEIATEKNSTIIFPAQFMTTVHEALATISKDSESK